MPLLFIFLDIIYSIYIQIILNGLFIFDSCFSQNQRSQNLLDKCIIIIANGNPSFRRGLSDKGQFGKNIGSVSVIWNVKKMSHNIHR